MQGTAFLTFCALFVLCLFLRTAVYALLQLPAAWPALHLRLLMYACVPLECVSSNLGAVEAL
jgi:hypothetical protein